MSCNWPLVTLSEVTSRIGDGLHGTPKYDDNGDYYFINGNNLSNGKIVINEKTKRTDESQYLKHKKDLNDRTLLVSINGTLGNIGTYQGEKVFLGKSACYLNVLPNVNKDYVMYVLTSKHFQDYIHNLATGSTIKNVGLKLIREYEFQLPDIKTQDSIANVLVSIDSKMFVNQQTNQTIEQMAQAIFKSWFVDFDPVKAKMNGEQPEGMDAATASLFPEKLVESELGLIPEGWEIQTIKSLSEKISKGTTPSKKDLASATDEPSIRFIKVKDINGQGEILRGKLETIPDSIHTTKLKRSILEKEDILFSIAGTIGRVAIVDQDLDNVNTNQAVAFIRLKNKQTYLPLVYMAMRENRLQQKAISSIVQGVQANLSLANVGDMEVLLPPEDILNLWNKQYSSILQMIKNNFAQSRQLASLRDTLLPKLLSGEIELGTSEELVEAI
ncbi:MULTISPECIES: restriction endonuclease subunit S [Photobacterium]|uniref:restriction endonuclease subunit S n=1 Tax=Photobacterium TaxID=657 RepID=UPI00128DE591|nr:MULTISPECIES: restriction endonuclease subunit S [Photobacterium]KAE8178123.1 restriction endonuclease subunit S [Photobacterium carnosum]MCD9512937.1 restriction endonuclease subunit S [Photobacterium phosphoreum]